MHKVYVIGLGPGSPDYVTPAALQILKDSRLVIGGRRNLDTLQHLGISDLDKKELVEIDKDLAQLAAVIKEKLSAVPVTVVASGDPGFYGILRFLRRHFDPRQLNVVAGISSIQYMCAKLGMCWDNAFAGSLHGKSDDIISQVKNHACVVYLTDKGLSLPDIISMLNREGYGEKMMHIGSRLSYENEKIYSSKVKEFEYPDIDTTLCVMVIADEQ